MDTLVTSRSPSRTFPPDIRRNARGRSNHDEGRVRGAQAELGHRRRARLPRVLLTGAGRASERGRPYAVRAAPATTAATSSATGWPTRSTCRARAGAARAAPAGDRPSTGRPLASDSRSRRCDIRFAAPRRCSALRSSTSAWSNCDMGTSWLLPRCSATRAAELMLTGPVSSRGGRASGIVSTSSSSRSARRALELRRADRRAGEGGEPDQARMWSAWRSPPSARVETRNASRSWRRSDADCPRPWSLSWKERQAAFVDDMSDLFACRERTALVHGRLARHRG